MATYKEISYKKIMKLLPKEYRAVKIEVPNYMPLWVQELYSPTSEYRIVSIAHTGLLNGDVMNDPEIVVHMYDDQQALHVASYRNDYLGRLDEVYAYDDNGKIYGVRLQLEKSILSLLNIWLKNLKDQGFYDKDAKKTYYKQ